MSDNYICGEAILVLEEKTARLLRQPGRFSSSVSIIPDSGKLYAKFGKFFA